MQKAIAVCLFQNFSPGPLLVYLANNTRQTPFVAQVICIAKHMPATTGPEPRHTVNNAGIIKVKIIDPIIDAIRDFHHLTLPLPGRYPISHWKVLFVCTNLSNPSLNPSFNSGQFCFGNDKDSNTPVFSDIDFIIRVDDGSLVILLYR